MARLYFIVPGDPETKTGGFIYDRRIIAGLRHESWDVVALALKNGFPQPSRAAVAHAEAVFGDIPDGATVVVDGLALGVLSELAYAQAQRLCLVALVHHPLAAETGLDAREKAGFFASERHALAAATHVIVPSKTTADALASYDVEIEKISVVRPGTDPATQVTGSTDGIVTLLCVASLTPRKGHVVLIRALSCLSGAAYRQWRLVCVGPQDLDPSTTKAVRTAIDDAGLQEKVSLVGEAVGPTLEEYFRASDMFVLASYYEGYGMVLAEALARGLPIVSTNAGAIPETVPTEAGLLVPPGDVGGLAHALGRLINSPPLRQQMADRARVAGASLPNWAEAARDFGAEIERFLRP